MKTDTDAIPKMIPAQVVGWKLGVRWQTLVKWGKDPANPFPSPHRYSNAWHFEEDAVEEWRVQQQHVDGPDLGQIRTP